MKNLHLIVMFLIFALSARGQSEFIPPPPEAASFFKSTDIPVSLYTGLPNVGIDFYTIQAKELKLPIRINYNARGIQVAEVASRVGLGWALQYGGMISRQIRGLPDENGNLYYNYYPEAFTSAAARAEFHQELNNGRADAYPDAFYFDFNGESGKFMFDYNDQQIVLQKFSDIKIVPNITTEGGIISWVVTDKFGNKFYFGKSKNGTRTANDYDLSNTAFQFSSHYGMAQLESNDEEYRSVWHLMEIETYLNEKIEFFYEQEAGLQYRRSYDKIDHFSNPVQAISNFSRVQSIQHQISEIRFPGGSVTFVSDTAERKDYTNTYPLKRVEIRDSLGTVVKCFELNHYYQRCDDDDNQLSYLKRVDTTANYRLFLGSVREKSSLTYLPPYSFEYSSVKLPNRFSNSQDSWGYYNGKTNGQYLTFFSFFNHVNRQVDTVLAGAGLLKKITYPTGGTSAFVYEQNRVITPPFMDSLMTSPNNPIDTILLAEAFFKDSVYYYNGIYQKDFSIVQNVQPLTTVEFNFILATGIDTTVTHYQVVLERLDSLTSIYLYPPNTTMQLNLDPGDYRLKVIPSSGGDTVAFIASLWWTVLIDNAHGLGEDEWYGAGKRIKRIEHKNNESTVVGFKEYEYLYENGNSSGKMFGLPNFYFIDKMLPVGDQSIPLPHLFGSIVGSPLSQLQGNSVGYERVTEYYGDSTNNQGKTITEFTADRDGGEYYRFPFHLPIDHEWLRGHPTMTKSYKQTAGTYQLQKSIRNIYNYAGSSNGYGVFDLPILHPDTVYTYQKNRNLMYLPFVAIGADIDTQPFTYSNKIYYQTAGTFDLETTIVKDYSSGIELTQETNYTQNYQKHYLSTGQTTINSKGDSLKSIIYYPLDIEPGNRTAAEQKLIDSNRVAMPVKQENVVKNNTNTILATTSSKTIYKEWGHAVVLPEYVQSSINGSSYENEIVFMKYNSNGSPLEILTKAGVTESYIWGYNKQYPVARIVGSSYASAVSFVDTTMLHNASLYTDAQIRTELNKIRTGLASTNAFVSTYTYKPLVGITSVTDPRSQIQFYEYDAFNRLSVVKDYDGKILKKVCYNYWGQPDECTTTANFQPTGITRCKPCPSNNTYSTNVIQNEQKDINPNSPTYNQILWVDAGTSSSCGLAVFVNEGSPYCEVNSSNQNTGNQLQLKRDMNPCSSTYYQTQVVLVGYNTGSCPLPPSCDSSNCTGDAYKCVDGTCEEGFRVNTHSYYDDQLGTYVCVYHYEWSDDTWSGNYYEYNQFGHCFIFGW